MCISLEAYLQHGHSLNDEKRLKKLVNARFREFEQNGARNEVCAGAAASAVPLPAAESAPSSFQLNKGFVEEVNMYWQQERRDFGSPVLQVLRWETKAWSRVSARAGESNAHGSEA